MVMTYFRTDNTADLSSEDRAVINRSARKLVKDGMSPTQKWLSCVRQFYKSGMSANDVVAAVNAERDALRP